MAIIVLTSIALICGLGLGIGYAMLGSRSDDDPIVNAIDALLPQTQCQQCGYPGCRPYAQAIADGKAAINQCPPGGTAGIRALATLLGREIIPLNPDNGEEKPKSVAIIQEQWCIGCTKCIDACPVDAIVGAAKKMHTVIADQCTGCELCVPPCPVDCIDMSIPGITIDQWYYPKPKLPSFLSHSQDDNRMHLEADKLGS